MNARVVGDQRVPVSRYLLFVALAVIGCAADLATKHWIFTWPELRQPGAVYWLWDGHVGLQISLNRGAMGGLGQGFVWVFVTLSVIAVVAIPVWLFAFGAARDVWSTTALGLVLGGVLGNLYDRLGLHGLVWGPPLPDAGEPAYAVRDWILWQWNDAWRWPNFNVADSLLVVGAAILLWHALWHAPPSADAESSQS